MRMQEIRLAPWLAYALAGIGGMALLVFYAMAWRYRPDYSDFDQVYMAGLAWRKGIAPYGGVTPFFEVPNGPDSTIFLVYYYLPLCSMLAAPLSFLPFPLACLLWRLLAFTALLAGVWHFSRIALPRWPFALRLFALGVTALSGTVRWNLMQQQPTALVVGLLLLFAVAVIENRWARCLLLGALVSIKASYLLPALGMLVFRRQWKWLLALLALIVALNAIALLPTGPVETLAKYRAAIAQVEKPGNMNYPGALDFLTPYLYGNSNAPLAQYAPQNREAAGLHARYAGELIHFPFIFSAWTFALNPTVTPGAAANDLAAVALAKKLALAATLLALGALAWLWAKVSGTPVAEDRRFQTALFAALMALNLLALYHQRYDMLALIPVTFVALARLQERPRDLAAWIALLSSFIAAYALTAGLLAKWHSALAVQRGLLIAVPLCGYLTLIAFLAASVLLWRAAQPEPQQPDAAA